jgi:hypothetical protein
MLLVNQSYIISMLSLVCDNGYKLYCHAFRGLLRVTYKTGFGLDDCIY